MLDYHHNKNNKRETDKAFWDKLIKILFISGASIIVIMIAFKWFRLID